MGKHDNPAIFVQFDKSLTNTYDKFWEQKIAWEKFGLGRTSFNQKNFPELIDMQWSLRAE